MNTQTPTEGRWCEKEKTAVYKPRRTDPFLRALRRDQFYWYYDLELHLHNCKEIYFCCLNHPVWDTYIGDLSCNSGLRDNLKSNKHEEIILRVKNVVIPRMRLEVVLMTIVSNMEDDMHDNMSLSAMAPTTK